MGRNGDLPNLEAGIESMPAKALRPDSAPNVPPRVRGFRLGLAPGAGRAVAGQGHRSLLDAVGNAGAGELDDLRHFLAPSRRQAGKLPDLREELLGFRMGPQASPRMAAPARPGCGTAHRRLGGTRLTQLALLAVWLPTT